MLSFGLETAMDAALPQLLFGVFSSPTFTAETSAYLSSTYGLLNLIFRPAGGILADYLYRKYKHTGNGVRAKWYLLLASNCLQGLMMVALGLYVNHGALTVGGVMGVIVAVAITGFVANAAAYSIYGHLRPKNVGFVAGLVGAGGNIGGICEYL